MQSLFRIQEEYLDLVRRIENGEEGEEVEQQLAITQQQLMQKTIAYQHVISVAQSQIQMAEEEKKRIDGFIQMKKNLIDRLKQALLQAVLLFGSSKKPDAPKVLEFDTVRLSTRRNPKINIIEEIDIPDIYKTYYFKIKCGREDYIMIARILQTNNIQFDVTSEPSKTKIKDAIVNNGLDVPGAQYDDENYSLVIK
jgi:hypothetical protein